MAPDHAFAPDLLVVRSFAFERLDACAVLLDGDGVIIDTNETWRLFTRLNDGDLSATGVGVNYIDVCDRATARGDVTAGRVGDGIRAILAGERVHFDVE